MVMESSPAAALVVAKAQFLLDPSSIHGPAVRCKMKFWGGASRSASIYPASLWDCCPGHHGYPRARVLVTVQAFDGHRRCQVTGAPVRPFVHSLQSISQNSAGKVSNAWANRARFGSYGARLDVGFVTARTMEDTPGDARQLVGQCHGEDIAV
jgi:hypothetical protein